MSVIDFERWRGRRRHRRAGGQIAALCYIREEIEEAGFYKAAELIRRAVVSIADEMGGLPQGGPYQASNDTE